MTKESNEREFTRVNTEIRVFFSAEKSHTIQGTVRDVSANGVFIACDHGVPEAAQCYVKIALCDDAEGPAIKGHGRVVRSEPGGLGIHFTDIVGEDSFAHLRNLVLYNSHDIDVAESEFSRHVGIKPVKKHSS